MTGGYPSKTKTINPNSPTHRWAKSLLEDELKGQKKISIKISTDTALREINHNANGETYDTILLKLIESYKIQKEIGPETLESIATNEKEEED